MSDEPNITRMEDGSRRRVHVDPAIELAPCPFCASTNVGFYEHVYAQLFAVMCKLCGAEGPRRASHDEAGRQWNRRTRI
ncbi:Lar family restriction alleviation protein [Novosphingobium sp. G106]|uniref:Lar family restriction alleviation protein n=1 Tax=Novosphingobium sp. G106 TaxID=2849500 RepID=UPI001C2D1CF0|nr:Lar family restriction alleviation protein [Novosphingobium sp. G106]